MPRCSREVALVTITLNGIQIDCNAGLEIANELSQASSDLTTQYGKCTAALAEVQASWRGENASSYCALLNQRAELIREQASRLKELSQAVRDTVAIYRKQQMAAYRAQEKAEKSSGGKGGSSS